MRVSTTTLPSHVNLAFYFRPRSIRRWQPSFSVRLFSLLCFWGVLWGISRARKLLKRNRTTNCGSHRVSEPSIKKPESPKVQPNHIGKTIVERKEAKKKGEDGSADGYQNRGKKLKVLKRSVPDCFLFLSLGEKPGERGGSIIQFLR